MQPTPSSTNTALGPVAANGTVTAAMNSLYGTTAPSSTATTLPKPAVTPTAPTGVASSGLANDTLATQAQGVQGLQSSVDNHAANKAAQPSFNPEVSITDLLSSKGQASDYASRAKLAAQAGIQNYTGTAAQNAQLIGYVNNPPKDGAGTSQSDASGSSSSSSSTTSTNGIPNQPATGSPGDQYSPAITKAFADLDALSQQRQAAVQQIMNGTFPLTSFQQTILTNTQSQFDAIAAAQATANKSYEGSVALAGNRLGTNIQNPTEYAAEKQEAVNEGLQKIQNLDTQAATTLATLQQGFLDKDYTMINDNYTALQKTLEDKATAITNLQKRTDDLYTSTRDYNEKVQEFAQSQAQQKSEFEQSQGLERAKFTAQYAGLIDPNTGLFKPAADPTQLPGVTSLPQGIGQGAGGYYLDVGQVPDKGLATYLEQAAKQNGYGVVDSSNNKTFNQSLSAYQGLQQLISSGAVDPNAKITDVIGNKKSSSLILRAFGSTQPDSISTILGAGGASVPNLNNMTLGQAASYLQSSIYSTMGTNTVAQKYAMNPGLATNDLQSYVAASPANTEAVTKLMTANPNLTDSQLMQVLTTQ